MGRAPKPICYWSSLAAGESFLLRYLKPEGVLVMLAFVAFFPWPSCARRDSFFPACGMRQQAISSLSISISTRGRSEQQLYPAAASHTVTTAR